ncbi:retrovirus-related pol polyprotein from transposon TNT 1-94 [Tanacetum coccineum]
MVVPISTREPKQTKNQSAATPFKRIVALESTNQKPRSKIRKKYEYISKTCKWWYSKITPPGYKWKPKTSTVNVTPNVSMPLGNKSRTTNILESITLRGSTLSNTTLSSNSFAARRDYSIHRRLWVLKAHDGKSQASNIVERRNRTLVEAARTMLIAAKVPLFFWAKAIAIACFTQNRSLIIPQHEKTPYHIINDQKPSIKFFYIFGSLCYIVRDGENLDKMKEKGDACIFVGYSTQSRAYRFKSRSPKTAEIVTTLNELDLLFSLMFDELLNGTTQVVSKSSTITTADAPNQRQQQNTTPSTSTTVAADIPSLNIQTRPETTSQAPTQAPTVTDIENIN